MKKKATLLLIAIAAAVIAVPQESRGQTPAKAETVRVKALGKSAHSYEHATELAIRKAVRQGAGVWIDSHSKVENFELIRDSIYISARGYVTRYDVRRKYQDEKFYYVLIDADVAVGKISAKDGSWIAIQHLIELVGRPDFMVTVEPRGQADAQQMITWIRGKVNHRIELLGLRVKFQPVQKEANLRDYLKAINQKDIKRARGLKTKLGAPFGVHVIAFSEVSQSNPYGVNLNKATVSLQGTVVSRSDAVILASKTGRGEAASRTTIDATKKACEQAADELFDHCIDRILSHWVTQLDRGIKVELEATGLKYAELSKLKKYLAKHENIKSVRVIENDPSGISVLDVIGLINTELVADAILEFDNGSLEPHILGPGRVGCKKASR